MQVWILLKQTLTIEGPIQRFNYGDTMAFFWFWQSLFPKATELALSCDLFVL